jgi:hypothetical protein
MFVFLKYFLAIWYNLRPFGLVCGHLVYFIPSWYVWTKKNLATLLKMCARITGNDRNCFLAKPNVNFSPLLDLAWLGLAGFCRC